MPLIELKNASVSLDNRVTLHDLSWRLRRGGHFAVLGGNGAGKSTLMRLLAGQIWPRPHDSRLYQFGEAPTWSPLSAREHIALLSPEIQERFVRQSQDGPDDSRGWRLDAKTAVLAGFFGSELLHQTPDAAQNRRAEAVLEQLHLAEFSQRPLQSLSQGQLRRVLLARALVSRPQLLLLDEACSGLDAASRAEMLELIDEIARAGDTTIGLCTHRPSEIIGSIGEVLTLEAGRFIEEPSRRTSDDFAAKAKIAALLETSMKASPEELIRLENVSVFLDGTPILRDLNWTLRRGEHFAIEGTNGAGKTTFMRLLRGEIWPAHGGTIRRFGEGKPLSRAAIGARVSLLSPALQARYADEVSVERAVASGWFDSFGITGELSAQQWEKTRQIIGELGLGKLSGRSFAKLSYGQRRRVLLARALVNQPEILLLDEALDGLDSAARADWHEILAEVAARGTSLIVTSHHRTDYPPFLTHILQLEAGRIVAQTEIP